MRPLVLLIVAVSALFAAPAASSQWDGTDKLPDSKTTKVKVEGETFEVLVFEGDQVRVVSKSLIVFAIPRLHRRMHEAVRKATGCDIGEHRWEGGTKLYGTLDCSAGAAKQGGEER